jgi:hypothetical protein
MTLSTNSLFVISSKVTIRIKRLNITTLCHYAECGYAECHLLFIVMLNFIMLSVAMLNVIMLGVAMLSVAMLSVVAPLMLNLNKLERLSMVST